MFQRMGSNFSRRCVALAALMGALTLFASGVKAITITPISAFGYGHDGELGNGNTADHNMAQSVSGLPIATPIAVAAGASHSLALFADGSVYAWGLNSNGQLGDGTTTPRLSAVQVKLAGGAPLSHIIAISAGSAHSLALTDGGLVYAWGLDSSGQLGDGGAAAQVLNPMLVPGLTNIAAIAAGGFHSLALTGNGKVYSWGFNTYGQLGEGVNAPQAIPAQIPGLTGITAIAGGSYHSLALNGNGAVFAWGRNNFGQLGDGTTMNRFSPVPVSTSGSPALTGVTAISAGIYHSVFLAGGTVFSVGYNGYGQLGDGAAADQSIPVTTGLTNVQTIAAGGYHTLAVRAGSLYSWGLNLNGQLGDGANTNHSVPTALIYTASVIAGGGSHSVFSATPLSSVSGALGFEGIAPNSNNQYVTFLFVPSDGSAMQTRLASIAPSGVFTIPNLPRKSYTSWIKGTKYLAASNAVNVLGGNLFGLSVSQPAGDANNDNSCDSTDFGLLIGDFNSDINLPGSGYEENVDLNGDGLIDSSDFGLLIGEFGNAGAPLP